MPAPITTIITLPLLSSHHPMQTLHPPLLSSHNPMQTLHPVRRPNVAGVVRPAADLPEGR